MAMSQSAAADAPADEHLAHVRNYNVSKTAFRYVTRTRRAEEYYQVIALPPRDLSRERLLIVGPRDMHEILMAWSYGFSWKRIEAIDLYATNPKITVMNMEGLTYPPDSFDSIVMAYTLAYAKDVFACLEGLVRVLRPGGHLAFGHYYNPRAQVFPGNLIPGEQLRQGLAQLPLTLYYYDVSHSTHPRWGHEVMHKFGLLKDEDPVDSDRLRTL